VARFSFGHALSAAGRGVEGYGAGRLKGQAFQRELERRMFELALRMAPMQERAGHAAALDRFLAEQPEGKDLAGRGLSPSAALGLYSGRLAARRQRQPTPSQADAKARRARADLIARAQSAADYIARTNQSPSAAGIYAYLRAQQTFRTLDDETLRGAAAEAVGAPRRQGQGLDYDAILRTLEGSRSP
jgi:hypothetical protein